MKLKYYSWLKYWAFNGRGKIRTPTLNILIGYIRILIRPRFIYEAIKLKKEYKYNNKKIPVFIHIPKTGGSSLLELKNEFSFINISHSIVRNSFNDEKIPKGFVPIKRIFLKNKFVFTTIRNPLKFLVSYYYHVLGYTSIGPINKTHYDYDNAENGFDFLVESIIDREDMWPSNKFLYLQLFDDAGDCVVDWINRQEELNQDFHELIKYYSLNCNLIFKRIRNSKIKDYRTYYSDKLIEKVINIYDREMSLFGYKYFDTTTPLLELKPFNKDGIKYNYKDNLINHLK